MGRAILSRNECGVQCVAQTCLEKGRAEEQVNGECKGEGEREREGNETGGGYPICFTPMQITGVGGSSHKGGARLSGGAPIAPHRDSMVVMACNVGTRRALISVTRRLTRRMIVLQSGNAHRQHPDSAGPAILVDPASDPDRLGREVGRIKRTAILVGGAQAKLPGGAGPWRV